MPVTTPVVLTVALAVSLLLQVPPVTEAVNEVVLPIQTTEAPDSVPTVGRGLMVMLAVATDKPQLLNAL